MKLIAAARKWVCDIANIRARHVLQILIRDDAGELKSADLNTYIESLGVKNYVSVAYEQYQNGQSESTINSLMILDGYCDADWGTSDNRRSMTGNIFRYNGAPIAWKSKLQNSVALSTAEAEYCSASLGAVEVTYLRQLLWDMAPHLRRRCMRTTQHALSGLTM